MLILARHIGQRVIIRTPGGERIVVLVSKIRTSEIAVLGFEAPAGVSIVREEVEGSA